MGWLRRARSSGRHARPDYACAVGPVGLRCQKFLPPAEVSGPAADSIPPSAESAPGHLPLPAVPAPGVQPEVAVRLAFRDGSALALGPDEPLSKAFATLADVLTNRQPRG
ncbi:MAG: hypothetical protein NVSMB13_03880 [Mycobacteriales bacterium]